MLTHTRTRMKRLNKISDRIPFAVIQIFIQIVWVALDQQCGVHKRSSIWGPPRTQSAT